MNEKIWTTKEGKEIPYKNLTDEHLRNILAFIEKRAKDGIEVVEGSIDFNGMPDGSVYKIYGESAKNALDYDGLKEELISRI